MIRINLLAGSVDPNPRQASTDPGRRVTVAACVIVVATVVVIAWRFGSLREEANHLERELLDAEREIARLGPAVERVRALDLERTELERRVRLVRQIRLEQIGPVHMLDQLSRAMPNSLWLSRLSQAGQDVIVEGWSLTLGALSDLIANLESSGYFPPPVEIIDSQREETGQGEAVRFELKARFSFPRTLH